MTLIEAAHDLEQAAQAILSVATNEIPGKESILNKYRERGGALGGLAENYIRARTQALKVLDAHPMPTSVQKSLTGIKMTEHESEVIQAAIDLVDWQHAVDCGSPASGRVTDALAYLFKAVVNLHNECDGRWRE